MRIQHNAHVGDEDLIAKLQEMGNLEEKVPGKKDLSDEDIKTARVKVKEEKSGGKL